MLKQELSKIFKQFNDYHILIIGDVMVDAYLWGNVSRISPEAPVPIVLCKNQEHRLGGAANVALNVQAMGANPILCSVIGNDEHGKKFLKLLEKRKLTPKGILQSPERITSLKTRIISSRQQLLRVDEELDRLLERDVENQFLEHLESILVQNDINAIIFQDYDKGVITPRIIEKVVNSAQKAKIPVLVDPKRRNFTRYDGVTLFKPNFIEFSEGLKLEITKDDADQLFKAARKLHLKNIDLVFITLSEKGVFISDGKTYDTIPAEVRDIADVSGAGDTVISVSSLCLAAGIDPVDLAVISNLAGGIVCEKLGVVPIEKSQLLKEALAYYQFKKK